MNKKIFRIILSPLIFVGALCTVVAGLILPTTMTIIGSFMLFFQKLIVDVINLGLSNKIEQSDMSLITPTNSEYLNHILGVTVILWFPFFVCYVWIIKGEIFKIS
jgi:hypothetical protein